MQSPLVLGSDGQFQLQPGWKVTTLTGTTVDKNTWTNLLEGGFPLSVPQNTTWLFHSWVVARGAAGSGGFELNGVISRNGVVDLINTKRTTVAKSVNSLKARAKEDTVNNALSLQVKGIKNETVEWLAVVLVTTLEG